VTTFEYLAVLFSVVVGLAITQTLQGLLRLIHIRDRVRFWWPSLVWTAAALQWAVFFWWFSALNLAQAEEWRFDGLLFVLAYAAALFFLLGLLTPYELGEEFDMRHHFERNRVWFFGTFLALGVLDVVDTGFKYVNGLSTLDGWRRVEYYVFLAVWLSTGITALRVRNSRFIGAAGILFLLVTFYVALRTPSLGVVLPGP
jgi:hypothetical protein